MKNLNSNLNPSMKDCAANAAATTVAPNNKPKRLVLRTGKYSLPERVAEFMSFIKTYLRDRGLIWDSTPIYKGVYTYPNGVQEHHVLLMHNGAYYFYEKEAIDAYNREYNDAASVAEAHHLYLPI